MYSPAMTGAPDGHPRAANHPFGRRWYVHRGGSTQGPMTGYEIRRMAARGGIAATDLVFPEGGSDWGQLKDDPILRILFMTPGPAPAPPPTASQNRALRVPTGVIATVIMAAVVGWLAWPYVTAYGLAKAARNGDVGFLERHVAWDSVRAGLRNDLKAVLLQKLAANPNPDSEAAGTAAFAAAVGPAIVDQAVNSYVTPEVVASLNRKINAKSTTDGSAAQEAATSAAKISDAIQSARKIRLNDVKYAFFDGGPLSFRIDVVPHTNPPMRHAVSLRFKWDGSWRLTRVLLPMQEIGASPSRP